MVKVVILLAPGFEPLEATAPADILRRCGAQVIFAAVGSRTLYVEGCHGITVHADKNFNEIDGSLFDAIVCPGGLPGATNLANDVKVVESIKNHFKNNKVVAAICASPGAVLADACKIVRGKRACGYPGFDDKITENGGTKVEDKVCVDGKLITSRGPGTSVLFGLAIGEALFGKEKAQQVRESMIVVE